ncbi:MAG: sulfotransferase domain-containing protein [Rhodospirillaceae bacterium]|nr:sulfotransferase domain-containing protein [Rhodospirillaceae bacterium]
MSEPRNRFSRPAGAWVDPPAFNRWTAFARLAPSFLILGAQRSGTTALYRYLVSHPNIPAALRKEVHYFDFQYQKGRDWYLAHFPATNPFRIARNKVLTGEASPYYLVHPLAPGRVRRFNPAMKLIVVLRDPIARAWSHYRHEVRRGIENLSFKGAVDAEAERLAGTAESLRRGPDYYSFAHHHFAYLDRGRYAHHLQAWLELFPRRQMLILKSDNLIEDANSAVNRVFAFLGLPPHRLADHPAPVTAALGPDLDTAYRKRLEGFFRADQERLRELCDCSDGMDI